MGLFDSELAPWEKRKQYYSNIKLGQDVNNMAKAIKEQKATLLKSVSEIVASQERIGEILNSGFEEITYKLNNISEGILSLQSAFEWGISEVVWQIEQNREIMKDILQALTSPLDTQARELRLRAEKAYINNWIDEALEDFLLSEAKNKYDFTVHISIGMIYLFKKINKHKALEYFEKAIKYAKPSSNYHTSFSLLYKGLILFDLNRIVEAEKATDEAIQIYPNITEAYYQNAQYNAQLNNINKSIYRLNNAINYDSNYVIKVDNDPLFNPIRSHVKELIIRLTKPKHDNALENINLYKEKLNLVIDQISFYNSFNSEKYDINKIYNVYNSQINYINYLINLKSYFDAEAAIRASNNFSRVMNPECDKFESFINLKKNQNKLNIDNEYWIQALELNNKKSIFKIFKTKNSSKPTVLKVTEKIQSFIDYGKKLDQIRFYNF